MEEMSRNQMRELHRTIVKGGHKALRDLLFQTEVAAYGKAHNEALQVAMSSVKTAVLDSVETTLREEFGFGDKRINKFTDAFTNALQNLSMKEEKENINNEEYKQEDFLEVTEEDKMAYMIFLCVRHYLAVLSQSKNGIFADKEAAFQLGNAVAMMDYAEQAISPKMKSEDLKNIYEEVTHRKLYLSSTEEVEK